MPCFFPMFLSVLICKHFGIFLNIKCNINEMYYYLLLLLTDSNHWNELFLPITSICSISRAEVGRGKHASLPFTVPPAWTENTLGSYIRELIRHTHTHTYLTSLSLSLSLWSCVANVLHIKDQFCLIHEFPKNKPSLFFCVSSSYTIILNAGRCVLFPPTNPNVWQEVVGSVRCGVNVPHSEP